MVGAAPIVDLCDLLYLGAPAPKQLRLHSLELRYSDLFVRSARGLPKGEVFRERLSQAINCLAHEHALLGLGGHGGQLIGHRVADNVHNVLVGLHGYGIPLLDSWAPPGLAGASISSGVSPEVSIRVVETARTSGRAGLGNGSRSAGSTAGRVSLVLRGRGRLVTLQVLGRGVDGPERNCRVIERLVTPGPIW